MHTPRTRVPRRPVHGVLLLDKPLGWSSQQALTRAKTLLRAEKAGHTGTLDPLATGVLPLCFGAATKFSQRQLDADKTYDAVLRLGQTTESGDAEGPVLHVRPVPDDACTPERLQTVAQTFTGTIEQVPPMHSALKHQGRPLYELARRGVTVERASRQVTIHALTLQTIDLPDGVHLSLRVRCSKGTYVRTLAEDIGVALGCGAHLRALRRIATGPFGIQDCLTLEQLEALDEAERLQALLPVESLLGDLPRVALPASEAGRFLSGLRRRGDWPDMDAVAVFGTDPAALLGSAHTKGGELIPQRLLSPQDIQTILQPHASKCDATESSS